MPDAASPRPRRTPQAFAATKYALPDSPAGQEETVRAVRERLGDLEMVVSRTEAYRCVARSESVSAHTVVRAHNDALAWNRTCVSRKLLRSRRRCAVALVLVQRGRVGGASATECGLVAYDLSRRQKLSSITNLVDEWEEQVEREKGVCHTLNKFNYDVSMKALIAEGWCAASAMDDVRRALRAGTLKSGATVQTVLNVVKTREQPPTYFKSSKMTAGFQAIVDAYGVARYQVRGGTGGRG